MTASVPIARSLATRLLLVVLFGGIIPVALVGAWLTRSAERSGRELLQHQLRDGARQLFVRADARSQEREGDLQLLANNAAGRHLLVGRATAPDSQYLAQLSAALRPAISNIEYRDHDGRTVWYAPPVASGLTEADERPRIVVSRPVLRDGAAAGMVDARVLLSEYVPLDSLIAVARSAELVVRDSSGSVLWRSGHRSPEATATSGDDGWERAQHVLATSGLLLQVAAPVAPYTEPFARNTRQGLYVLGATLVLSLFVTIVLVRQLTASLRALTVASGAVASGALDRQVVVTGDDEVAHLARSFNVMVASLRDTLGELSRQRSLAAVGEFAAALSHEVRNGLTAVHIDLQHAARHLSSEHAAAPLVQRTVDSVRRLDGTVTSALRLARSGQVARTAVDLSQVLRDAERSAQPVFSARGVELTISSVPTLAMRSGDSSALLQLFVNLLMNAAQATPGGRAVAVGVQVRGAQVIVTIADEGEGFDAELLPVQRWRTTKPDGTGLGLSMARRIAEAHGGTLTLEGRASGGTLVTVALPA